MEKELFDDKHLLRLTVDNAKNIATLTEVSRRTSEDVDKLIRHADKFEKMQTEHNHILGRLGHLENQVKEDRKRIDLVYTIMRYPKLTAIVFVGVYSMTIYEIRTAVLAKINPILSALGIL